MYVININGGYFTKKYIPYVLVIRTAKHQMNLILNFTAFTQQRKSVHLFVTRSMYINKVKLIGVPKMWVNKLESPQRY